MSDKMFSLPFFKRKIKAKTASKKRLVRLAVILCLLAAFVVYRLFIFVPAVENFSDARRVMENYVIYDERRTVYCDAAFDDDKRIAPPPGFFSEKNRSRAGRMEWEHAVPVENFGRSFRAWREGHEYCEKNGKPYRGRKCAARVSRAFRKMEADMYNLFPSIGAVNAARGHRAYAELPDEPAAFGSCAAKIAKGKFEPPDRAKGEVARASLYMDAQYDNFSLSRAQKRLFEAWDRKFPVTEAECRRSKRIWRIQKNENRFVKKPCVAAGWW